MQLGDLKKLKMLCQVNWSDMANPNNKAIIVSPVIQYKLGALMLANNVHLGQEYANKDFNGVKLMPGREAGYNMNTFEGLPLHAKVDIVEDELSSPNGWVTYYYDGGEVVDDDTHTHEAISVTNARAGSLELSKRVSGNSADPNDVFEYRVNITDSEGKPFVGRDAEGEPFEFSYRLSGTSDSVSTGSIKNGDTVRLRAGQKIVISDIPHGAHYSVKETADSAMGYEIEPVRSDGVVGADAEEGTIVGDATTSIAYENVRNRGMGALSVSKTLSGDAADPSREFCFVARFYHPDGTELTEGESERLNSSQRPRPRSSIG